MIWGLGCFYEFCFGILKSFKIIVLISRIRNDQATRSFDWAACKRHLWWSSKRNWPLLTRLFSSPFPMHCFLLQWYPYFDPIRRKTNIFLMAKIQFWFNPSPLRIDMHFIFWCLIEIMKGKSLFCPQEFAIVNILSFVYLEIHFYPVLTGT